MFVIRGFSYIYYVSILGGTFVRAMMAFISLRFNWLMATSSLFNLR